MPRFYFHLHNDIDCPDDDGVELSSLKEARTYALHTARFTAGQSVKDHGRIIGGHRIDIENDDGQVLETVYFREAVKIEA